MSEYFIKAHVNTGNLLPPYRLNLTETYEANTVKEAIAVAKKEYIDGLGLIDAEAYPLIIDEVTKVGE